MSATIRSKIQNLDWPTIAAGLHEGGYALTPSLLTSSECKELIAMYPDENRFRSHIIMARYRFGSGDYKYFN